MLIWNEQFKNILHSDSTGAFPFSRVTYKYLLIPLFPIVFLLTNYSVVKDVTIITDMIPLIYISAIQSNSFTKYL